MRDGGPSGIYLSYYNPRGKGRTQKRKLDNALRDDFEKGQMDKFKITCVDLGDLKGVYLFKHGSDGLRLSTGESPMSKSKDLMAPPGLTPRTKK